MKKIVVIEDDTVLRENMLDFLREEGYDAYAAQDGAQGLLLTKEVMPDLVLCDIGLPKINGYDTCIAIKKVDALKDIPVVFLTALSGNEAVLKGFNAGAQDFVVKPFHFSELLVRIKKHIDLKCKKDQLQEMNYLLEKKVKERTAELEKAYNQLESANTMLEKLDLLKTEFLNIISHELRTPLNGIMDPLQLLKLQVENKNMVELIRLIDQSAIRLEEFSLAAIEITRLKTGKSEMNFLSVSLDCILELTLLQIQKKLSGNVVLMNHAVEKNVRIKAHKNYLINSLANIIESVNVYLPNDGTLEIGTTVTPKNVCIFIKSKKTGLIAGNMKNLFEFFRFDDKKCDQRQRLKLYLSQLVIEMHHGHIHFPGSMEPETILTISFPVLQDNSFLG